jgi:hypothetical protein
VSRVFVPSAGPESWKQFLAKPDLHWAVGYSARTLANSWEAADGIPPEVAALLQPIVGTVEPLIIIPERKTPLPGGQRHSQSDVFLLGRHAKGTIACTIEGKVDEPFGPTVTEKTAEASPGQHERMRFLCATLGIRQCPGHIRYQLLHRTASALVEAERFDASDAAMIVHSFSPGAKWLDDYTAFVQLLGGKVESNRATVIGTLGRPLILGWAAGDQKYRAM